MCSVTEATMIGVIAIALSVFAVAAALVVAATVLRQRQAVVTKEALAEVLERHNREHSALDRRLDEGNRLFIAIRADIDHLPTRRELMEISSRTQSLDFTVKGISVMMEGIADMLVRIEQPLQTLVERQGVNNHPSQT
jgi:hypothetical protein